MAGKPEGVELQGGVGEVVGGEQGVGRHQVTGLVEPRDEEVPRMKLTPRTKSRRLLKYRRLRGTSKWKGLVGEMSGGGRSSGAVMEKSEEISLGSGEGGEIENGTGNAAEDTQAGQSDDDEVPVNSVSAASENSVKSETQGAVFYMTTGSIPIPSTGSIPSPLTKSLHKVPSPLEGQSSGEKSSGKIPQSESSGECRKANRRKLLGQAVVAALKRNGMPRSHQHFKKCFEQLFKLSKIFLEVRCPLG
jgi:hypothetical protein